MLELKDLRQGNWVIINDSLLDPGTTRKPYQHELTRHDIGELSMFDDGQENGLEPIPLSPEILIACGFEYLEVPGVVRITDEFDSNDDEDNENTYNWTLLVKQSDHCDRFRFEIVKWGATGDFTFSNQWLRIRLKYLHQLQNLYFALSQQELIYKP